jgi:catechol-2,3-dioxygenase
MNWKHLVTAGFCLSFAAMALSEEPAERVAGPVLEDGGSPVLTPQLVGVVPTLSVSEIGRARNFYTQRLGFVPVVTSGSTYLAVGRDAAQIGLARVPKRTEAHRGSCYFQVSGVDALYEEFLQKGVKMEKALATQPSKMREFTLKDPDGNTLMFGEYVGR